MSLPGCQIYIFLTLIFLFLVPSRGMKCYFLTSRKLYHMKFAIFDVARCRMSATSLTFLLWLGNLKWNFKKIFFFNISKCQWTRLRPLPSWNLCTKSFLRYFFLANLVIKSLLYLCLILIYYSDIWFVYPKLISEKWNLTAKSNCLTGHYFATQRYRGVPMCARDKGPWSCWSASATATAISEHTYK